MGLAIRHRESLNDSNTRVQAKRLRSLFTQQSKSGDRYLLEAQYATEWPFLCQYETVHLIEVSKVLRQ